MTRSFCKGLALTLPLFVSWPCFAQTDRLTSEELAKRTVARRAEQPANIPTWLQAHVGEGEGQIHRWFYRGRARFIWKK